MNETLIFIHANELVKLPPEPISLNAVLDAMLTYCPDYMHGIPKKRYVNFLKREIARPDRAGEKQHGNN